MQISSDRTRIQFSGSRTTAPTDVLSNGTPAQFVGDDWQIECALFTDNGTFQLLADISDVASLTFELKQVNSKSGLPLLSQTLTSGQLNNALTLTQWQTNDPAQWQALFTFPNALTSIPLSSDQQTFWFTIYAITTDARPKQVVWGCGQITLINSGSYTPAPAYVQQPIYLTLAQANALFGGTNLGLKVNKSGDTMSGPLQFSGTAQPGLILNSLTTAQMGALTGVAGMSIFNTTTNLPYFFVGSAWKNIVTSVNGATGSATGGAITLNSDNVAQGTTNLYCSTANVLATPLTGFASAPGVVAATDTVLTAFNKITGNIINAGVITSIGLSMPAGFTVTGSPLTSNGTLAVTFATASQNFVLAGPTSGAGVPTWRFLVAGDIPNITQAQVTGLSTALATYLPLAGGTLTGALTLPSATPTGLQATSLTFTNATYLQLAGGTLTGALTTAQVTVGSGSTISWATAPSSAAHLVNKAYSDLHLLLAGGIMTGGISFNSTTIAGITLNNLSSTQRTSLTGASGMVVVDTTLNQVMFFVNGAWQPVSLGGTGTTWFQGTGAPASALGQAGNWYLDTNNGNVWENNLIVGVPTWQNIYSPSVSGFLSLTGGTMSGALQFSGTGNPGLRLNNLTTTQQNALTTGAGTVIFNTTLGVPSVYNGSSWNPVNTKYDIASGFMQYFDGASWQTLTGASVNITSNSFAPPVNAAVIRTTSYAMVPGDSFVLINGNAITITLPSAPRQGQAYWIKNDTLVNSTIVPSSGNIETAGSYSITTDQGIACMFDGTNWWILAKY